ncbi:hypothetical protein CW304_30645 [Bacillus sp. UFRGS-B20]|nr:hypothetical protein CW304_30645 [Bacillus sp. UFRGS-B20]
MFSTFVNLLGKIAICKSRNGQCQILYLKIESMYSVDIAYSVQYFESFDLANCPIVYPSELQSFHRVTTNYINYMRSAWNGSMI